MEINTKSIRCPSNLIAGFHHESLWIKNYDIVHGFCQQSVRECVIYTHEIITYTTLQLSYLAIALNPATVTAMPSTISQFCSLNFKNVEAQPRSDHSAAVCS